MSVEKRLSSLKGVSPAGDPELFISDLKGEMVRRARRRQNLVTSLSGMVVALAVGVGLYIGSPEPERPLASVEMSGAIIDLSGESDSLSVFDEEDFVLASIDYLVDGTDLMGTGWSLVEDLSLYDYLEAPKGFDMEEKS